MCRMHKCRAPGRMPKCRGGHGWPRATSTWMCESGPEGIQTPELCLRRVIEKVFSGENEADRSICVPILATSDQKSGQIPGVISRLPREWGPNSK